MGLSVRVGQIVRVACSVVVHVVIIGYKVSLVLVVVVVVEVWGMGGGIIVEMLYIVVVTCWLLVPRLIGMF